MIPVPIADSFLAGSLLTLLLPTLMLTALVVWYVGFVRRAPGPEEASEAAAPTPEPAESAPPEAAPPQQQG